ncbi:MAG: putative phosphothreonine lyase domain-containing protein [Neisseriaceae bacterium]
MNKTNDLQLNTPGITTYLKDLTRNLFKSLLPKQDNNAISQLADNFLFLIKHRDGKTQNSFATRASLLRDFLEDKCKPNQNRLKSIITNIPHNISKIFDQHIRNNTNNNDNNTTRFKYLQNTKKFYNSSTTSDIQNKTYKSDPFIYAELHDQPRDHFEQYFDRENQYYKSTDVFEPGYYNNNVKQPKSGKFELYISPNNINEYWRRIQIGISLGLISIAKVALLKKDDGTTYTDAETENQGKHCLMIYVEDFTNQEEVLNMFNNLLRLGIIPESYVAKGNTQSIIKFKPDLYTEIGFYGEGSSFDNNQIKCLNSNDYKEFVNHVWGTYTTKKDGVAKVSQTADSDTEEIDLF